jgi:poly(3-hydroxybutyrate) depolymerase
LQETPWVLDAQSEAQQKKNIGLLFDFNKMASEQKAAMRKIVERQYQNGGLPWFPGCRDNEYVTSYAIENIGHLYHLGVVKNTDADIENMLQKALSYCDLALNKAYEEIKKILKAIKS